MGKIKINKKGLLGSVAKRNAEMERQMNELSPNNTPKTTKKPMTLAEKKKALAALKKDPKSSVAEVKKLGKEIAAASPIKKQVVTGTPGGGDSFIERMKQFAKETLKKAKFE